MPDQERKYGTRITTAGSTLITNCILAGTKLKITQAAAGDGGGSYYLPSTEQTELVRELWRGPIVSAEQNASVPNMLDVKIIIDDSVGNFIVREMGLFDEDGTLIAICNTPDTEKVAISTGVDGRLTMLMHIVVVDSSVLEFTATGAPPPNGPAPRTRTTPTTPGGCTPMAVSTTSAAATPSGPAPLSLSPPPSM